MIGSSGSTMQGIVWSLVILRGKYIKWTILSTWSATAISPWLISVAQICCYMKLFTRTIFSDVLPTETDIVSCFHGIRCADAGDENQSPDQVGWLAATEKCSNFPEVWLWFGISSWETCTTLDFDSIWSSFKCQIRPVAFFPRSCTMCPGQQDDPQWFSDVQSRCFFGETMPLKNIENPWQSMRAHESPWKYMKIRKHTWTNIKLHGNTNIYVSSYPFFS